MRLNEKIIRFQNAAEEEFKYRKTWRTTTRYTVAFLIFMGSTVAAGLLLPFTKIRKMVSAKSKDSHREIHDLSEDNIRQVLKQNKLVLLDFWAAWCGPCIMMDPILKEFAVNHKEVLVGKVDADNNPALIQAYKIKGIPQLILIKDGKEYKRHAGALTMKQLIDFTSS